MSKKENDIVIDIYFNVYQYNLAKTINLYLNKHNIATYMTTNINQIIHYNKINKYQKHILFILSYVNIPPNFQSQLENSKYVIYQLENLIENINIHKYNELFKHAMYIYDYSEYNIRYYPEIMIDKIKIISPPIDTKDKIDILFYGTLNERRLKILNYLKTKYNVVIITNVFGEKLIEMIKRSKIILNISYYNNSLLEISRINECIQFNSHIISETPKVNSDEYQNLYKDKVIFIKPIINDYSELCYKIEKFLNNDIIIQNINDRFHLIMNKTIMNYFNEQKYKMLFHKVNLHCVRKKNMDYNVDQYEIYTRKLFCHIHCFDLSNFTNIFSNYLYDISRYFHIIVTYSVGVLDKIYNHMTIIKVNNNGFDIGGKMMMIKYLNDKKIYYDYVFFLHSKSDNNLRHEYFDTLYDNMEYIVKNIYNYDGYFPNLLYKLFPNYNIKLNNMIKNNDFNYIYTSELKSYLNIDPTKNTFCEGNVYILSKPICEKIFGDERLYVLLNESDENDYVYLQNIYKLPIINLYHKFKHNYQTRMIHDGLFEHSFERCVMPLCNNHYIAKPIINIIIRESSLIPHILEQKYSNLHIICSEHIDATDYANVTYVRETEFTDMIKHVTKGWLLFLESNYRYNDSNAIHNLSKYLYNSTNIIKVNITNSSEKISYNNIIIHNSNKWEAMYIENMKKHCIECNDKYIIKL
jgi:hypothetical protein